MMSTSQNAGGKFKIVVNLEIGGVFSSLFSCIDLFLSRNTSPTAQNSGNKQVDVEIKRTVPRHLLPDIDLPSASYRGVSEINEIVEPFICKQINFFNRLESMRLALDLGKRLTRREIPNIIPNTKLSSFPMNQVTAYVF